MKMMLHWETHVHTLDLFLMVIWCRHPAIFIFLIKWTRTECRNLCRYGSEIIWVLEIWDLNPQSFNHDSSLSLTSETIIFGLILTTFISSNLLTSNKTCIIISYIKIYLAKIKPKAFIAWKQTSKTSFLEVAGALLKIGLSLKPNHHREI